MSAGLAFAGDIGAQERLEYTVIGAPVNEAARLSELAKSQDGRVVASERAVRSAVDAEGLRWDIGELVELRGPHHAHPRRPAGGPHRRPRGRDVGLGTGGAHSHDVASVAASFASGPHELALRARCFRRRARIATTSRPAPAQQRARLPWSGAGCLECLRI